MRLARALALAFIFAGWGYIKVNWELSIAEEQHKIQYGELQLTPSLRDQLGQQLTIAVLGGMRAVAADYLWLWATIDWENENWIRMRGNILIVTFLQPRCETFWVEGGAHLGSDAACEELRNPLEPSPYRRMRSYRFYVEEGRQVFIRGLDHLPYSYNLWERLAILYDERLHDEKASAYCYFRAAECPDAPVFLERFSAYMLEKGGFNQEAYLAWSYLYHKLTPKQLTETQHWGDKIKSKIRYFETKLNVPTEKRIFP